MTTRDPEYDRFGPWTIEISESDPPPPLFLPYLTKEDAPLLSIKIPRKIERRNAHPGMNLYDYVVSLYQEKLVILKRVGNNVKSETSFYRDVQYLQYGEHLLKGDLRLSLTGKVYDLPFNTVSSDVMRRLVDLIRQRYTARAKQLEMTEYPDIAEGDLSFLFSRLLAKEKAQNPQVHILATQTETSVGSYETGAFRRLLFGIISKRLLESVHLSDGRELKIINRGRRYKYKGQMIHGTDTFYIPISKITGATWKADPKNAAISSLILETTDSKVPFTFIRDNPAVPSYARFLSEVSG